FEPFELPIGIEVSVSAGRGSVMPRLAHGAVPTPEQVRDAHNDVASRTAEIDLGFAVGGPGALQDFDFLFPPLQNNPANLLPQDPATPARLKELGRAMVDPGTAT